MKNILFVFACFPAMLYAQWQPANGPYGGMVWDMKSNAQAVFATQANGVFRSFDGGRQWAKCDTARVHHLTVHNRQVTLISYDHYFLRSSEDGGNTWTTRPLPDKIRFIRDWAKKDSIILISTNKNLWRSADGGKTWAENPIPGTTGDSYDAVEIINNRFYVSRQLHLFHSANGLNWQAMTPVPEPLSFLAVFQLYGQADTLLAFTGPRLFRSGDGGISWASAVVPSGTLGPLPPNFARYKNHWYAASGQLLVSKDAGISWTLAPGHATASADLWAIAAAGDTVLCGSQSKGVFQTRNAGNSFVSAIRGLTGTMVTDVLTVADTAFAWDARGISRAVVPVFAWDTGTVYQTPLPDAPFSDLKVHRGALFARQSGGHLMRTKDGGKNWQMATPPGFDGQDTHFQMESKNDTLLLLESVGKLWYTTDLGITWKIAAVPAGNVTAMAVQNKAVFIVSDSKIYHAVQGISTWAPMPASPAGVSRVFATPGFLLALAPGNTSAMFVSANAGQSWQPCNIPLPPTFQGQQAQKVSVFQVGSNILIGAFEHGGVFASWDNGLNWKAFDKGLPDPNTITELADHDYWLLAATGEGVFYMEKNKLKTLADQEPLADHEIFIYPNPVGNELQIQVQQRVAEGIIFNLSGSAMLHFSGFSASEHQVSVSQLPSGVYFLRLQMADGSRATGRFVKK